jgi:AraC family transcriptional regulator
MNAASLSAASPDGARTSLLSSSGRGWEGFSAELLGISAGTHRVPAMAQHRIGIHVGKPVRARCICDGRRHSRIQAHGDADVIPAGFGGEWTDASDCTVLRISFEDAFVTTLREQLEIQPSREFIPLRLQLRDARLQHLAWALHAELEARDASDPLYAESVCTALLMRLSGGAASLEGRRKTLAPKAAAQLADYIEGNIDQRLTLAQLAQLLDISVPHLKVLFRETFGMPVHRYVVQRRVERAKTLLLSGELSAAQVALDVGFSHQSHMARWISRLLGVSPRELVRSQD